MKKRIWFTLVCFLTLGAAFGQPGFFGYVEPLVTEDPEPGARDEAFIMEVRDYRNQGPVAAYRQLMDGDDEDSVYSDDEGEIDYPDEDEGNRGYYCDDDTGDCYDGSAYLRGNVPEEQGGLQALAITRAVLNAVIRGVVQPFSW